MNPVLQKMLTTGQVTDLNGGFVKLHSNISEKAGQMLRNWIKKVDCVNSIEVGLAFGVSSLFILDELTRMPDSRHHGIDPMQFNDRWQGLGLENIKRAGLDQHYLFYNEPSFTALPKIYQTGKRFQFSLIDGWHTFDYALVDFFYIDKLLDENGVVVLDDVGYKAIRKVATFILSNLDYTLVDAVKIESIPKKKLISKFKSNFAILSRDDWTPSARSRHCFDQLEGLQTVVLQKNSHDSRSFNHFCPF